MAKKDRICVSQKHSELLKGEYNKDNAPLGINLIENKDKFKLAVALGCRNPQSVKNRVTTGYYLLSSVKTADKAIMASVLLSKAETDEEVDRYSDMDKIIDYTEQCAETGFEIFIDFVDEANGDEELLERRLLTRMDMWYATYVEGIDD